MTITNQSQSAIIDTLIGQLGSVYYVVKTNTQGITHEDSMVQPSPGGNCLNWVMGHIMTARNGALQVLGKQAIWDEQSVETYQRGSPPLTDQAKALPFDKIMADFDKSQELITAGLRAVTAERLAEKAPFSPTNNPDETVGSLLAAVVFHDAYHAGQTALLRRITGKEGAIK